MSLLDAASAQVDLRNETLLESILLNGEKMHAELVGSLLTSELAITVDGASTITLTLMDPQRKLLVSGLFTTQAVISVPGSKGTLVNYALVAIKKVGSGLTLTFEDALVTTLRQYDDPRKIGPDLMTRVEFAAMLFSELPFHVPFVFPGDRPRITTSLEMTRGKYKSAPSGTVSDEQLTIDQLAKDGEAGAGAGHGFVQTGDKWWQIKFTDDVGNLPVSGTLTPEQIATYAAQAGFKDGAVTIATAVCLAESGGRVGIVNSIGATGLWQILKSAHPQYDGSRLATDPAYNAAAAFDISSAGKNWRPWEAFTNGKYKQFLTVATQAASGVSADGTSITKTNTVGDSTEVLSEREDTWTCLTRIFNEVRWRLWCFEGVVYALPEDELVKVQPVITIAENTGGVNDIDFDLDIGKPITKITFSAYMHRFAAWPGDCVAIGGLGPHTTKKYLLSELRRSFTSPLATVTLITSTPPLPEPPHQGEAALAVPPVNPIRNPNAVTKSGVEGMMQFAESKLGGPYVWGGNGPTGYDCSGLVHAAAASIGVAIPRTDVTIRDFCIQHHTEIPMADAVHTRGAFLWHPGHCAFAAGSHNKDGSWATVEAMGQKWGIVNGKADGGRFVRAFLIPGVQY